MADQEFIMTMHTLNKYGVPCIDVTDYPGRASATSIAGVRHLEEITGPGVFYLQKTPYEYLINTKLQSLGVLSGEFEPITGIPWTYCFFRNDMAEWGGKGYCDYYSLRSGALLKTVELPFQVGSGSLGLLPAVDINSDMVVYSAVEYEGCPEQYNRFSRDVGGFLTHEGRLSLQRSFYYPDPILYLGGNSLNPEVLYIPPITLHPENINIETDVITVNNHGLSDGSYIQFDSSSGTPPGGLNIGGWYIISEATTNTFKLQSVDFTSQGIGFHTFNLGAMAEMFDGYDGGTFQYNTSNLRPSNYANNLLHMNSFGEDKQTGRFYKEALPNLSADSWYKRKALGYDNLFVGELAPGPGVTIQVPFSSLLPEDAPYRESYTFLVDVFDDHFDDGSGKYTIGSGQIQGIFCSNTLFIVLTFDDIRGDQGNQAFHKWYDSSGTYLHDWELPTFINEGVETFYTSSGRVYHGSFFFSILSNDVNLKSYLYTCNIWTGANSQIELPNPYVGSEGVYKLSNQQLIDNKYIMVHTTAGHHLFFDVYQTTDQIVGEVIMDISTDQVGYFVIPLIGDDQPTSLITNRLLQLCNSIRYLKMTWAVNQVQVCQDHADWCTSQGLAQHEGPVAGQDASTSLRNRNDAAGIYAGVSENITVVMESDSDTEQAQAYANWISSPNHLNGIKRAGNKYMSWACSTYPVSVTEITMGIGMWDGSGYTTDITVRPVAEFERGKLKLYVQNFIWY